MPSAALRKLFFGSPWSASRFVARNVLVQWVVHSGLQDLFSEELIGQVASRVVSLGISSAAALGSATRFEAMELWSRDDGSPDDVRGIGLSRAAFLAWHSEASRQSSASVLDPFLERGPSAPPPSSSFFPSGATSVSSQAAAASAPDLSVPPQLSDISDMDDPISDFDEDIDFDLAAAITESTVTPEDMSALSAGHFADSRQLAALQAEALSARIRGMHFVSRSGPESWHPGQLSAGAPRARNALAAVLPQTSALSVASFLSSTSVFWLSHFAIKEVSLPAVMAHQLILLQIVEERGLSYAVSYEDRLRTFLAAESQAGNFRDVSGDISCSMDSIRRDLDLSYDLPPARPSSSLGRPLDRPSSLRRPICFLRDSRTGSICVDADCRSRLEHFDTSVPALAARLDKAASVFLRLRGGSTAPC
jgi:hypothetical protein